MSISSTNSLSGTISVVGGLSGQISEEGTLSGSLSVPEMIGMPYYEGSYEVTPTQHTQVLGTAYKGMRQNVVVNPIPSNYGLVTWTGNHLRIS